MLLTRLTSRWALLTLAVSSCSPSPPPAKPLPKVDSTAERLAAARVAFHVLDAERAHKLLDGLHSADARLLDAKISLAELDFARVEAVLTSVRDPAADRLLAEARWYGDRLDILGKMLEQRDARDLLPTEIAAVMSHRTDEVRRITSKGAEAVELPVVARSGFEIDCRIEGVPELASFDLRSRITRVSRSLVRKAGWAEIEFGKADSMKVRVPVVPSDIHEGISVGNDVAQYLHARFDYAARTVSLTTAARTRPPGSQSIGVLWLGGWRAVTRATLHGPPDMHNVPVVFEDASSDVVLEPDFLRDNKFGSTPSRRPVSSIEFGTLRLDIESSRVSAVPFYWTQDIHVVISLRLFRQHRVTIGADGRELWIE